MYSRQYLSFISSAYVYFGYSNHCCLAVSGRPKCECHAFPLQFNFLPVYSCEGIICIDDKLKGQNRDKYNDLFSSLVNIHRHWTKMLNDDKQQGQK